MELQDDFKLFPLLRYQEAGGIEGSLVLQEFGEHGKAGEVWRAKVRFISYVTELHLDTHQTQISSPAIRRGLGLTIWMLLLGGRDQQNLTDHQFTVVLDMI